jgi:hypothetical protein
MADKKTTKRSKAKPKATAKCRKASTSKSSAKKSTAKSSARKSTTKKSGAKKSTSRKNASGVEGQVEQLRESLERSVTLNLDRLQDAVDDAVKRGRITRGDAEKLLSDLVKKGRKQTQALLKELERVVKQARKTLR